MATKRCATCGQVKPVELFDAQRTGRTRRSSACKDCRRRRQARAGYATARNRALWALARRYPAEYRHYHQQARQLLAPGTAPATAWHGARSRAMAELIRRHRRDWQRRFARLRAAHPDWRTAQVAAAATNQQRLAHHRECLALLRRYAGAHPAGPALINKLARHALRRLQLAHPDDYQALYAAARAQLGNPITPPPPRGGPRR